MGLFHPTGTSRLHPSGVFPLAGAAPAHRRCLALLRLPSCAPPLARRLARSSTSGPCSPPRVRYDRSTFKQLDRPIPSWVFPLSRASLSSAVGRASTTFPSQACSDRRTRRLQKRPSGSHRTEGWAHLSRDSPTLVRFMAFSFARAFRIRRGPGLSFHLGAGCRVAAAPPSPLRSVRRSLPEPLESIVFGLPPSDGLFRAAVLSLRLSRVRATLACDSPRVTC